MASPTRNLIRAVLKEQGTLRPDEIAARLADNPAFTGKNPTSSVRNALMNDGACVPLGDGR